jgi:hypothetical protein
MRLNQFRGHFTGIFRLFHGNIGPLSWENAYRQQMKGKASTGKARSVMTESVSASTWSFDSHCAALMPPRHGFNGAQYDDILSSGGLAKTGSRTAYIL